MADDIDYSSDMEITFREQAIEANRKSTQRLKPIGKCYNCEELVAGDRIFCDPACHEDWAVRIKRIRGFQMFEGAS